MSASPDAWTSASLCERIDPTDCEHCQPLRRDSNVLVLARVADLRQIAGVNLALAILSTLYLGVNLVCFVLTTYDNDCFPCPAAATSGKTYHRLEFAATFCFAVVGTLSLVYSPERRFASPLVLKALVFFNINATFVAALFVFINVEKFETLSHEIEYANELTMALVDLLLLSTMLQKDHQASSASSGLVMGATLIAAAVAVVQLAIYNMTGQPWTGEVPAHYLEFSFETVSSAISFWFCIDNMLIADQLKREIMLAPDTVSIVIDGLSKHAALEHLEYVPPPLRKVVTQ